MDENDGPADVRWYNPQLRKMLDADKPIFRGYNPLMWYKHFFNKMMAWQLKNMDASTRFGQRIAAFLLSLCGKKPVPPHLREQEFKKDNKSIAAPVVVAAVARGSNMPGGVDHQKNRKGEKAQ
jgi:hypothetical protein